MFGLTRLPPSSRQRSTLCVPGRVLGPGGITAWLPAAFDEALSPVVLFSDALDRPCDVPLRVWTIVLAALHGYGANAICTPCLSLHQLLARLFCCWWQFEASRTLSVRTPRGVVQIRHVPRPKRVVYFDIALLTIYVVWCLLGFAWVRGGSGPEGSSDKTPGAPCSSTAPELFYSSALTVTGLLGLVVSWLLCNVGALAVRRGLVQSGFNVFQASPGDALERQTAVPYDPAVFEAEDAPLECHICLEEFGASREISPATRAGRLPPRVPRALVRDGPRVPRVPPRPLWGARAPRRPARHRRARAAGR
ncbi:unnamed protein product, partial [Prorocentrum cordatum]